MNRLRRAMLQSVAAAALLTPTTAPPALAGPRAAPTTVHLQAALDDLQQYGILGAVLCVDTPGRPRAQFTTGYADGARRIPMSATLGFQIGSQTKTFTAAAIVRLAKDGRLRLDDPVTRYLPQLGDAEGVTIRQLLQHTSGIGDGIGLIEGKGDPPSGHFDLQDVLLLSRVAGREFAPGARWHYNNAGYALLGRIIEIASGQSRTTFIHQRLLDPLGLRSTRIGSGEDWSMIPMAAGYAWSSQTSGPVDMTRPPDLSWAGAAGDMVSTADDLVRWSRSLLDPRAPSGISLADLTESAVPTGISDVMQRYGQGIGLYRLAGRDTWGHGGFIHGYITLTTLDPSSGTVIVILASLTGTSAADFPALKTAVTLLATTATAGSP